MFLSQNIIITYYHHYYLIACYYTESVQWGRQSEALGSFTHQASLYSYIYSFQQWHFSGKQRVKYIESMKPSMRLICEDIM